MNDEVFLMDEELEEALPGADEEEDEPVETDVEEVAVEEEL